jgi:iron complex outermembrane receptor protein
MNEPAMTSKRFLLSLTPIVCLCSFAAEAQDTGQRIETRQRDEIVVTARLREEDLQSVPISITAISEEELEKAGIQNLEDVANFTPNLTFESGASARRSIPTIRGLGAPNSSSEDNNVGLFIDGVYVNTREGMNFQMLDLERIEVIKGPQGALYGRSTFAGAINYITRKPTEETEFGADATYGEHNLYQISSFVSGAVAGDQLVGRIAAGYQNDDGTYRNGTASGGLGGYENYSVSGTLRWLPKDEIDLILNATYMDQDIGSAALGRYPNNCGINPAPTQDTVFYTCGEVPGAETSTELGLSPEAYSMQGDQLRLTAQLDWDLEPFTFSSITAFTTMKQDSLSDLDRTQGGESNWGLTRTEDALFVDIGKNVPVDPCFTCLQPGTVIPFTGEIPQYFNENSIGSSDYWSQEFRISSPTDQRLVWMGGLFYYEQESDNQTGLTSDLSQVVDELPPDYATDYTFIFEDQIGGGWYRSDFSPNSVFVVGAQQNIVQLSTFETKHWAGFGFLEYNFTDQLTGTAEIRYTNENRILMNRFDAFFGTGETLNDRFSVRDTFLDPRFTLRYTPTDELMFYTSAARGHRAGGCNPGELDPALEPLRCYKSESNWTYEVGAKSSWFDGIVLVDLAVFFTDWTDVQFRTQFPGAELSTIATNLGDLESKGAEIAVTVLPTDNLTLKAAYGYSDPKFTDDQLDFGTAAVCAADIFAFFGTDPCESSTIIPSPTRRFVNIKGTQLRRTSKRTFNAVADYQRQLAGNWNWYTRWDYRYQSRQFQEQHNATWIGGRNLVNARIGIASDNYDISFWVDNLTDEETPMSVYAFTSDLNNSDSVTSVVNNGRKRWGITGRVRF